MSDVFQAMDFPMASMIFIQLIKGRKIQYLDKFANRLILQKNSLFLEREIRLLVPE